MEKKFSAIVSDFDDTISFSRDSISAASLEILGKALPNSEVRKLIMPLNTMIDQEIIDRKGYDGNDRTKNVIYSLAYTKYSDRMIPNTIVIDYIKNHILSGFELVVLSARGEEFREETERALDMHSLKYSEIILPKDHTIKDEEWKLIEMEKLSKRYDSMILLEDKLENIQYIANNLKVKNLYAYLVEPSGELIRQDYINHFE